ncbi:hypothetical protein CANDROIZ_410003 [Candidatus Roizmanbacteria bacterium]|nr:hypothetical protein CANDROIZ_410003 [Candidatus Roizmanbacteria bacterium]
MLVSNIAKTNLYSRNVTAIGNELPSSGNDFHGWLNTTLHLKQSAIADIEYQRSKHDETLGGGLKYEKRMEESFLQLGDFVGDFESGRRVDSVNLKIEKPVDDKNHLKRSILAVTSTGALLKITVDENNHVHTVYVSSNGETFNGKLLADELSLDKKYTLEIPLEDTEGIPIDKSISPIVAIASINELHINPQIKGPEQKSATVSPKKRQLGFPQK